MDIDVFISYTHRDNKPLANEKEDGEGWISRFHHYLKKRLGELLGREPVIWRDFKLQGNDLLDEEIVVKLRRAKVLVAVVSPSYLNSGWCIKELKEFLKTADENGRLTVGTKSRVFKVVKTFVPCQEHPEEIQGVLGYEFFHFEQEKDKSPHEFIPEKDSPTYYKFHRKLDDLAWEIHALLKTIDEQNRESPPILLPGKMPPPGKTVYLAETSFDLREDRENIQRSLKQQGYTILPDRQLPLFLNHGNFRDEVRKDLERCKLSIHLVGDMYGAVPEEEEQSIIDLQNQLAMEQCKENRLTQLILVLPGRGKEERKQRQENYINHLRNEAPRIQGVELLETGLEDFKTVIRDTLEIINNPPPPEKEEPTGGMPRVYLVCDETDLKDVKPVDDCFYDGWGFEVIKPFFKGDVSQRREMHKEYLSVCDAMMIYYNHANEYWLHTKLNDLRKAPAYRKTKTLKAGAVFITGKKTDDKEEFRTHEANVIREYRPHFCDVLLPFVTKIKEEQ